VPVFSLKGQRSSSPGTLQWPGTPMCNWH